MIYIHKNDKAVIKWSLVILVAGIFIGYTIGLYKV